MSDGMVLHRVPYLVLSDSSASVAVGEMIGTSIWWRNAAVSRVLELYRVPTNPSQIYK